MDQNYATPDACAFEMDPDLHIDNIKELRISTGFDVKICTVMKTNAYGHGIKALINALLSRVLNIQVPLTIMNSEFQHLGQEVIILLI